MRYFYQRRSDGLEWQSTRPPTPRQWVMIEQKTLFVYRFDEGSIWRAYSSKGSEEWEEVEDD
jgi:hypothetical protein